MTEEMDENLRSLENYLVGLTDVKLEGKNEFLTIVVKNLLNKNMSDLEIIEITNLNQKELENIKKELNN